MFEHTIWNEWYPVAVTEDLQKGRRYRTRLLGQDVEYGCDHDGEFAAYRSTEEGLRTCRTQTRYHTHWVSLGNPEGGFFAVPEFDEPDRRVLGAGSMKVHVSGLRVVENFLDMAHFPFVHTGLLGEEPHTDVKPYEVRIDAECDEIYAMDCKFYQPMSSFGASGGIEADYIYRVVRPFVAFLYKTSAGEDVRLDVICLFVQPLDEEHCVAHTVLCYLDEKSTDSDLRLFQQTVFGQDLMILSNHLPRTLPLDPKFEVPTRADAMSAAYRRWLRDKAITYGVYQTAA